MKKSLMEIINSVLINNKREEISFLSLDDDLRIHLGFDSIMMAELTVNLEDVFGIDIFDNGLVTKVSEILNKLHE